MTPQEANKYMEDTMLFVPRFFTTINQMNPEAGKTFADFYNSFWRDGALTRAVKELIFMACAVSYCSPRCVVHAMPAVKAGATIPQVFEAAAIAVLAAGFVPGGPGIPYAFEYAVRAVEIAQLTSEGKPPPPLPQPQYNRGIY